MALQEAHFCSIVGADFITAKNNEEWLIDGKDFTDRAIAVYTILRSVFFDIGRRCGICSLQTLYKSLGINQEHYDRYIPVKQSMQLLCQNGYIKLWDMFDKTKELDIDSISQTSIFKVEFLLENEEAKFIGAGGFVKVPEKNMDKLLTYIRNTKANIHRYQLIRYYLIIARICSNDAMFGFITQEKIRKLYGFSSKTCKKYNQLLVDLELIFCEHDYKHYDKKRGKVVTGCTFYGHRNVYNKYNKQLTEEGWVVLMQEVIKDVGYKTSNMRKSSPKEGEMDMSCQGACISS